MCGIHLLNRNYLECTGDIMLVLMKGLEVLLETVVMTIFVIIYINEMHKCAAYIDRER